jgi:transposase
VARQVRHDPAAIEGVVRARAGGRARVGLETGPLTPWLVHELRGRVLEVVCLDARQARAALALRPDKMGCPGPAASAAV